MVYPTMVIIGFFVLFDAIFFQMMQTQWSKIESEEVKTFLPVRGKGDKNISRKNLFHPEGVRIVRVSRVYRFTSIVRFIDRIKDRTF